LVPVPEGVSPDPAVACRSSRLTTHLMHTDERALVPLDRKGVPPDPAIACRGICPANRVS
jgi:hypothetical protein